MAKRITVISTVGGQSTDEGTLIPEDATVADVITLVTDSSDYSRWLAKVNGVPASPEDNVPDGARVVVYPANKTGA